jgi:hypothetical protein
LILTRNNDGTVNGFNEISTNEDWYSVSKSSSLLRTPAPLSQFSTGSVNNVPFRPGGLKEKDIEINNKCIDVAVEELFPYDYSETLKNVYIHAPNFKYGLPIDTTVTDTSIKHISLQTHTNDSTLLSQYTNMNDDDYEIATLNVVAYHEKKMQMLQNKHTIQLKGNKTNKKNITDSYCFVHFI